MARAGRKEAGRRFEYDGPVHIRPIGRGIILEDTDRYLDVEIEDLVGASPASGWNGRLRILVEARGEPND